MQIALRGYVSEEKCVAEGEFSINCCPVMVLRVCQNANFDAHAKVRQNG